MFTNTIELAVAITNAWLGNANTRASIDEVSPFLTAAHAAIMGLEAPTAAPQTHEDQALTYTPAVSVRASLANPDKIVSMIDGKAYSSLTRHLSSRGITPDEYRQRYGLKPDYPMVAPGYSKSRSEAAKSLGLGGGRRKGTEEVGSSASVAPSKEPRRRLGIAAAKEAAKKHLEGGR